MLTQFPKKLAKKLFVLYKYFVSLTKGILKMDQIIKVAWELNENTENRYQLVYEIAELAKKLVDENQAKKSREDFGFDEYYDNSYKRENPVEHAIMVKASEADDNRLVG